MTLFGRPVVERVLIVAGFNIAQGEFTSKKPIKTRVRSLVADAIATELVIRTIQGAYRLPVEYKGKVGFFQKGWATKTRTGRLLTKTARIAKTTVKTAAKGATFAAGVGLGAYTLTAGADVLESTGIIEPSTAQHAYDFSEQALYVGSLGSVGKSPMGFKEQWRNVFGDWSYRGLPEFLRGTGY
jgi:hypothetical protein